MWNKLNSLNVPTFKIEGRKDYNVRKGCQGRRRSEILEVAHRSIGVITPVVRQGFTFPIALGGWDKVD